MNVAVATAPKWKQSMWAVIAVLGLVLVLGIIKAIQIMTMPAHVMPPESVTTTKASEEIWQQTLESVGSFVAVQGVTLSAEAAGRVDKILFESGQHVEQGQVLVKLDTSVEEAQLRGAQATLENANKSLERTRALRAGKASSQADLDTAEWNVRSAQASVDSLTSTIARRTIVAPFAGRAGIRLVNVGEYLAAGAQVVPLESLDPIYINFSLPQQDIGKIAKGQKVRVAVDAYGEAVFEGEVTAVDPQVDSAMRVVRVQATLSNADEKLRPGMFARVSLVLPEERKVVTLPSSSINFAPYGNTVFVVKAMNDPTGKEYTAVEQRSVTTGDRRGNQIAVLTGLTAGEEVVTSGTFKLMNKGAVTVNNNFAPENNPAPKAPDT